MPTNAVKSGTITENAWDKAKKIVEKNKKAPNDKWAEVMYIAKKITNARKRD